jgi:hypothetical protein
VFLPALISGWVGITYANQPLTLTLVTGGALIIAANGLLQCEVQGANLTTGHNRRRLTPDSFSTRIAPNNRSLSRTRSRD